jgi:hypothetical protein
VLVNITFSAADRPPHLFIVITHKGVFVFVLGLHFKPSKGGGERILHQNVIYYYHPTCGMAQPLKGASFLPDQGNLSLGQFCFRLLRFIKVQLGGRKLLVSIYLYHGLISP